MRLLQPQSQCTENWDQALLSRFTNRLWQLNSPFRVLHSFDKNQFHFSTATIKLANTGWIF